LIYGQNAPAENSAGAFFDHDATKFAIKCGAFSLHVTAILISVLYTIEYMSVFWTFLVKRLFLPFITLIFTICAVII